MAHPKRRAFQHIMEDSSRALFREKIPAAWVIRQYAPDYGIDLAVELFGPLDTTDGSADTLGEHLFVQLKSVAKTEIKTERVYSRGNVAKGTLREDKSDYLDIDVLKLEIDTNELFTIETMGHGVPVLLVLTTLDTRRMFFVCLNDLIDKVIIPEDPNYGAKQSKVINVPVRNEFNGGPVGLTAFQFYAKRQKLYAAFNLFEYQRNELEYAMQGDHRFLHSMLLHFDRLLLRLDIWDDANKWGWELVSWYAGQLGNWRTAMAGEGLTDRVIADAHRIWTGLVALGHTYEEICREWFLPTNLAQYTSYPQFPEKNSRF